MQQSTIRAYIRSWTFLRVLQLVIGVIIGLDALRDGAWFLVAISALLVYQALANKGCGFGGDQACKMNNRDNQV